MISISGAISSAGGRVFCSCSISIASGNSSLEFGSCFSICSGEITSISLASVPACAKGNLWRILELATLFFGFFCSTFSPRTARGKKIVSIANATTIKRQKLAKFGLVNNLLIIICLLCRFRADSKIHPYHSRWC